MEDLETLRRRLEEKVSARLAAGSRLSDPDIVELSQQLARLVATELKKQPGPVGANTKELVVRVVPTGRDHLTQAQTMLVQRALEKGIPRSSE